MNEFLNRFNITEEKYLKTGLVWEDLLAIREDFIAFRPELIAPAKYLVERFHDVNKVHSVRYRIKNPDHLIAKIIRKRIDEPERVINIENYKSEITDLIGLRILHLFKEDWHLIHDFILENWGLHEEPTAYYRTGDSPEYIEKFIDHKCQVKEHPFGYRSVHYLVETKPSKTVYIAEVQVRTIFEEAWSEIDHKIRYPYDLDNRLLSQFLVVFNRLAGSADEMGSYVQYLKRELYLREKKHLELLEEKTQLIEKLKEKIKDLELEPQQFTAFETDIEKLLNLQNLDFALPKMDIPDLSTFIPPKVVIPDLSTLMPPKVEIPDLSNLVPPKVVIPDQSNLSAPKTELPDNSDEREKKDTPKKKKSNKKKDNDSDGEK
ncbi:hypothetical protein [uncultured Sunxiuqinia sp.]|uniref:RelA/SpoT domain-containing protein n=1 Tax=uncultured Sunxiuqinia sp. TaxID=1573825 RepID=UPI002AA74D32|nr:hypothetical protein [uncultured Sunxiuqinia sp.]